MRESVGKDLSGNATVQMAGAASGGHGVGGDATKSAIGTTMSRNPSHPFIGGLDVRILVNALPAIERELTQNYRRG
jgi:hypothetical protein